MDEAMDLTCREFIDALASKAPAPGGGGAAAYVGAIGVALGNMVGSLTVGKPQFADVEPEVIELKRRADHLQERLVDLVAMDAAAFIPLANAYKLPKGTEQQRAHKEQVMEMCLYDACAVPLDIMRACCEAIDLHERFAEIGAPIAISDVGCGVVCCKAALQAASLNVFINTKSMRDRGQAEKRDNEAHVLLEKYLSKADAIFESVKEELS